MSWSWNADEEEKEYEVKGTVTISTEEYRDLIERVSELKIKGQREHDDWYNEYKRAEELKKKVDSLQKTIDLYNKYINSSELRTADYAGFLRELKLKELEENNEN